MKIAQIKSPRIKRLMRRLKITTLRVPRGESGSALALVLLVSAFVAGVAYYAMSSSKQTRKNTQRVADRITYGGLATALAPLVEDSNVLFDGSTYEKNSKMTKPLYDKTNVD